MTCYHLYMDQTLTDLIRTRQETARHLTALDALIAEQSTPLWHTWLTAYLTDCTQAKASSILTGVNRFLEDRDLPLITAARLGKTLLTLGYIRVRKADANYYTLRR